MPAHARRPTLALAGGDGGPPTHADLLEAIREVGETAATALHQSKDNAEQLGLYAVTMQRVENKLDDALKRVGTEGSDDHGKAIGTGISGRLMRLEDKVRGRFRLYDDLRNFAIGFGMAASLFLGALWWVLGDRLAHLLRTP